MAKVKICPLTEAKRYRIGVDVGLRGIGLAAIETDDADVALEILAATTVRIDGGIMPGSEKSPVSRLADAGVARRTRRLTRRKRYRLDHLDRVLSERGYPLVDEAMTYEPWEARNKLVTSVIDDQRELKRLVSIAVRHIARHRGWRNPWLSQQTFRRLPTPSSNHLKNLQKAEERFGRSLEGYTVGQLGYLGTNNSTLIRPRTSKSSLSARGESSLFSEKVLQEDNLAEINAIWDLQGLPKDDLEAITQSVFYQNEPTVPLERLGRDVLPGMRKHYRALRASLEFQEYRILAVVGNLRVRDGSSVRSLNPTEFDRVFSLLEGWHRRDDFQSGILPTWTDVASELEIEIGNLRGRDSEESAANRPPWMRSLSDVETKLKSLKKGIRKPILEWYESATDIEIATFVNWLADATEASEQELERTGLADVIATWDETALEALASLELENGRAAYSSQSLKRLNKVMRDSRCDVHEARKIAFNVSDDWAPPLPYIDEPVENPTVDQNLTYVRRFVMQAVEKWGIPTAVNIEHVRDAFLGPNALAEQKNENNRRANQRERYRESLKEVFGRAPTQRDIKRYEYVERQNSQCAYCGQTITATSCELDHIVPRKGGGASTRANLVCRLLLEKKKKSKVPFAVWAKQDQRKDASGNKLVSLADTRKRVRSWNSTRATASERRELREIQQRLGQQEHDEQVDERSMESTAYAATEIRDRVQSFLNIAASQVDQTAPAVKVYRGSIISSARKASQVDKYIHLRDKEIKDRGDYRHHAIDASVIAMMNPSVSHTLALREKLRIENLYSGDQPEWKRFSGSTPGFRETFQDWCYQMGSLAELLKEAIGGDEISVQIPLRLNRRVGRVHQDNPMPLDESKSIEEDWSTKDLARVVDREVFQALKPSLKSKPSQLPGLVKANLYSQGYSDVKLFGSKAAQIPVRGGGAELRSIHHARVLAWKNKKNEIQFGMQRVYAGEIKLMWPDSRTDLFRASIPEWSMSRRDLSSTVEKVVSDGQAVQVGWIVLGDELLIDLENYAQVAPNKFREANAELQERHWTVSTFNDSNRINLKSRYLSAEGNAGDQGSIETVVSGNILVSVGPLMPHITVIRRNSLGQPRHFSRNLPFSFRPIEVANKIFDG
ncbi:MULTISPECIES: type II CRISPR RNA-guided endonuclease Cas9 [Auritidibacter]|nr:type II CRISPR RNA-guided endonuclease Cas9 [Auritidibacter ignavus]